ncbi:HAD family hydrolase [Oceanirhabdus seepicola]|uniref:HAD family phosphatase n=1 Tax=Oceanirhabdus seepicola TaxID=2828781 RepID=A0A9J6P2U1_9CLOT|nr:HAD family phosphatase [Oceanirhabdus seepicola]MCM1990927.1 HAD family phosphatase [Oceanirhabdus seepicola]
MIKNIIFDIGNVLLKFEPRKYLTKLFNNKEIEDLLFNEIFKSDEWLLLDKGSISETDATSIFVERLPERNIDINLCMSNWKSILVPIKENVEVLKSLHNKGYNLYILSNFHKAAYNHIIDSHDFFSLFHGGAVSFEENLLKPNIEFFNILLDRYALNPCECLFIDDTLDNITAASSLGVNVIHYTGDFLLEDKIKSFID